MGYLVLIYILSRVCTIFQNSSLESGINMDLDLPLKIITKPMRIVKLKYSNIEIMMNDLPTYVELYEPVSTSANTIFIT